MLRRLDRRRAAVYTLVMAADRYTLSQLAVALGEAQHRLIHLCEKRVILPAYADAHGRGSSRQFSLRNVLEFAVSIELRALDLPVASVGQWIRSLDSFVRVLEAGHPPVKIPADLLRASVPRVAVTLFDADKLVLTIGDPEAPERALEGPRMRSPRPNRAAPLERTEVRRLIEQARTLLRLELSRIAVDAFSRLTLLD